MTTLLTIANQLLATAADSGVAEAAAITADEQKAISAASGAGLAYALSTLGPGIGLGILVAYSVQAMARQPEAAGKVQTTMFIGIAVVEALAIIGFVVFILLKFA